MKNISYIPYNFLGLRENCSLEESKAVIVPVPYERTVSFGTGTSKGPQAVIMASRSLELYDEELDCEPCSVGIHTIPEMEFDVDPGLMTETLCGICEELITDGKFIICVGGEHSVSNGPITAFHNTHGDFSVLSIDAHCDLRQEYGGTIYSHACVMRRAYELGKDIVQAGIRSLSAEEAVFLRGNSDRVKIIHANRFHSVSLDEIIADILKSLGERVYISVDLDGFDPSFIPSTGTPEPGGLNWFQVISILREVFREKEVIGMDVVELIPSQSTAAPDVLAAKLIYKSIGYRFFSKQV